MEPTISRRTFTAGGVATILGGGVAFSLFTSRSAAAQGGTEITSLGLPTIDITVTADALEGAPTELEVGRYLVTLTLAEGVEYGAANFISPPPGMTVDEFWSVLESVDGATPEAAPDASPAAEEEELVTILPSSIYQAMWAGGAVLYAEQPEEWAGQAAIDLPPGEWILWTGDPVMPQPPVFLTVTEELPADLPEPAADIDVTFIDFGISVEGALTAGDHVMRIENLGAQPHFLVLGKGPDTMTNEQIAQLLEIFLAMEMGEAVSPEAIPFDFETDFLPLLDTAYQSIGTVNWVPVALEAGTYAGLCFFPTAGEGLPHAIHGMHTVFKVE